MSNALDRLEVPGLAEKRPSIILGDKIRVKNHGGVDKWFVGYVHRVEQSSVLLRFHPTFNSYKGQRYDVCFFLCRSTIRRMHHALSVAWNSGRLLFPSQTDGASLVGPTEAATSRLRFFNRLLEDNPPQRLAVTGITMQPPGSVPFIIFGPWVVLAILTTYELTGVLPPCSPGTGKTVVAVEAMRQILDKDPSARLLACAPSNSAADLLADRLRQQGIVPSEMFRLNAPTRPISALSKTLKTFSRPQGDVFIVPTLAELSRFRVIVATCFSTFLAYGVGVPRGHFSHIFIDEAGQALEPEAMIAIRTMAGPRTNVVLSGDPRQLGPIVRSPVATKLGFALSYLDRLMQRNIYQPEYWEGKTFVLFTL